MNGEKEKFPNGLSSAERCHHSVDDIIISFKENIVHPAIILYTGRQCFICQIINNSPDVKRKKASENRRIDFWGAQCIESYYSSIRELIVSLLTKLQAKRLGIFSKGSDWEPFWKQPLGGLTIRFLGSHP